MPRSRVAAISASVSTQAPRAPLTSSDPGFIRARKSVVHEAARLVGERREQHDDVGLRQQFGQFLQRRDVLALGSRDLQGPDLERLQMAFEALRIEPYPT